MTIESVIDEAWLKRDSIGAETKGEIRQAVDSALAALDCGEKRIAEKVDGEWRVNQWLKKAVLLSFRLNPMEAIAGGPGWSCLRGARYVPITECHYTMMGKRRRDVRNLSSQYHRRRGRMAFHTAQE